RAGRRGVRPVRADREREAHPAGSTQPAPRSHQAGLTGSTGRWRPRPSSVRHTYAGSFRAVHTVVLRVWLPDRPGALGQVASRIGSVRGDVLGIEILESGGGRVVDELVIGLADSNLVDLLI